MLFNFLIVSGGVPSTKKRTDCGPSLFADFENTVTRGPAVNFGADSQIVPVLMLDLGS